MPFVHGPLLLNFLTVLQNSRMFFVWFTLLVCASLSSCFLRRTKALKRFFISMSSPRFSQFFFTSLISAFKRLCSCLHSLSNQGCCCEEYCVIYFVIFDFL